MSNILYHPKHHISYILRILIWPFPLIVVGALRIHNNPFLVGITISLALIPWLVRCFFFRRPMQGTAMDGALVLLLISAFVGLWASYDIMVSLPMLLTLSGSVSLFYTVVNADVSPGQLGQVLVGVAALLAFYFIGQTFSVISFAVFTPHPNAMAGFLEGALLLALVLAWQTHGRTRWCQGMGALVIAFGLLLTGSRGAWTGLVVAIGIWGVLLAPKWAQRLGAVILGMVVGVLFGLYAMTYFLSPDQQSVIMLSSALGSIDSRLALYQNSLFLLGDYPFTGIGLGDAFALVYSRYSLLIWPAYLFYAHNMFLSVALGFGTLGLVALIWLIISFYYFVISVERSGLLSASSTHFFRASWLGTTAIFVHGLTDSPHFSNYLWTMPMLFVMLGLTTVAGSPAMKRFRLTKTGAEPGSKRFREWIAFAGIVVGLILAIIVFRRPLVASWYVNLGTIYHTQADLSNLDILARDAARWRAKSYFEHVLKLSPWNPVANRRLGMMALDQQDFDAAITYLERARQQQPGNQATLKALGLAYQWAGQPALAKALLEQLDKDSGITVGPDIWQY